MNNPENGYHISFFKPTTEQARFNRNLVIWLASIWFVAIFGFQIALRVLEEPTPEPSYLAFQNAWQDVKAGTADAQDLEDFGTAALSVLGKVAIEENERTLLSTSMSWAFFQLLTPDQQIPMKEKVAELEQIESGISDIRDMGYLQAKGNLVEVTAAVFNLDRNDPRTMILPIELSTQYPAELSEEAVEELPGIMEKYLVHNQSFLTDARFLGFPFHYFYTAVFLLILFVGLCWLYCVRADRRNLILGIED